MLNPHYLTQRLLKTIITKLPPNIAKALCCTCILAFGATMNHAYAQCFKQVSAGYDVTEAIKADGSLWICGGNYGSSFVQKGADNNWKDLSGGRFSHTLAIKTDGSLWAWGDNSFGQLGDGTKFDRVIPVQIGTDTNWASISAGDDFTMALKTDGSLWGWGWNFDGELGDGTGTDKISPIQIGTATDWASISAGKWYTMAIKTDGSLWAWGANVWGQLGDGTTINRLSPVRIGTATNWASVSTGHVEFTMAIKSDGSLWAWGYNGGYQLGLGHPLNTNSPAQVGTDTNWKVVSGGYLHSIGIKTDGSLWACGYNGYGQFGDGTNTSTATFIRVGTATDWKSISAGSEHTTAIKTGGSFWTWGRNDHGQLGDGTTVHKNVPTAIACSSVFPLQLLQFTAQQKQNNTQLSWQTANEINTQSFQVERSINAGEVLTIGTLQAVGKGDNTYHFIDPKPSQGTNYYRLKMIDKDGVYTYSKMVAVSINAKLYLQVYPNPTDNVLHVQLASNTGIENKMATLRIINAAGKVVKQQRVLLNNDSSFLIDIHALSAGKYFVSLSGINDNEVVAFVKK